ncbi:calcineurin B-like protein 4 [Tanacetum coccineum]|uniref:F-actin-capping protein subunit beta n=1 Tax=Tanacetum coccineum TaxID=301880 RepID=A0ABQ5INQ7_9ASTR
MKADGTIAKHKARLVIKEFRQREGLDYFDTYSPVTRITSTRMVLAIAALRNLEVHLMDVKPTFLNGDLEEEIYMNQPQGFIAPGLESKVCRLVKSLYDLRKAPKQGHQISPYHPHEQFVHPFANILQGRQERCRIPIHELRRSPWSNKFHPDLDDGMYPLEELRKLEVEANEVGPDEEGMAHYCLTSTVMLSLTTDNDTSGTFNLSGSIRRQMEDGHLCNMGKKIEELEGKLRNQLDQVYHFYSLSSSVYLLL